MTKTLILSGTLSALLLFTPAARAADEPTKIATVDMQKALQSVESGKKAKSQLEKEFAEKKAHVATEEGAIRKMAEEFKKQSLVLSDEARAKKQQEIQERAMKNEEFKARSQMELQEKERKLTEPIIGKLRGIVQDLAKKKGYSMVLEKSENTVIYSQDKDDLTADVISSFNKDKS